MVILRAGTGSSLLWELQQARAMLAPQELFILVSADQGTYHEFADRADRVLPYPQSTIRAITANSDPLEPTASDGRGS